MKALNQAELAKHFNQAQKEYEANQKLISELEAKQAALQKNLSRIDLNRKALGARTVSAYPDWLIAHS